MIRFDFIDRPHRERYWLLNELGDTEICRLPWARATSEGRIQLDGLPSLVRAFPTWNARSMLAHVKPISITATSL